MTHRHRDVSALGRELASSSYGVLSRRRLSLVGVDRFDVRTQIRLGRWEPLGHHSLRVVDVAWNDVRSPIVAAAFDAAPTAWADGVSALLLAGLSGWRSNCIDLAMPATASARSTPEVRHHRVTVTPLRWPHPIPRAHEAIAAVRAAAWAETDRQAAALLSMSVQQRLVHAPRMTQALDLLPKLRRRAFIRDVIADISGGSESMGELDFVAECRRRGLPIPDRQVLGPGPRGRMYLDVVWEAARLCVEIDGAHHYVGDVPMADALRQNEIAMGGLTVMRIPRLALRVSPEPFFAQIQRYLSAHGCVRA